MKKDHIIVFCCFAAFLPSFKVFVHQENEIDFTRARAKKKEILLLKYVCFVVKCILALNFEIFLCFSLLSRWNFIYYTIFSSYTIIVPVFCKWHENTCIQCEYKRQPAPCIYSPRDGGGIAAIFRLFADLCHFIYQKRIFHLNMSLSLSFVWYRADVMRLPSDAYIFMWYECMWLKIDFSSLGWIETSKTRTKHRLHMCARTHSHFLAHFLAFVRSKWDYETQIASMRSMRRWECFWWDWSCCKWHDCGGLCITDVHVESAEQLYPSQPKKKTVNSEEGIYSSLLLLLMLLFSSSDVCQLADIP